MSGKLDLLMKIALEWHQVVQKLLSFLLLLITVKKIKIREYCLFLIKADLHFQQSMEFHSQLTDFWLNFTFNYHSIGWSSLPTPQNSRFKLKVEFSRLLQVKTCHDQEIVKFSYFDFFFTVIISQNQCVKEGTQWFFAEFYFQLLQVNISLDR